MEVYTFSQENIDQKTANNTFMVPWQYWFGRIKPLHSGPERSRKVATEF